MARGARWLEARRQREHGWWGSDLIDVEHGANGVTDRWQHHGSAEPDVS
ncbi:MAG: hypothetical protein WBR33_11040 [Pseudonocardiaceae bacterium]